MLHFCKYTCVVCYVVYVYIYGNEEKMSRGIADIFYKQRDEFL